MKPPTNVIDAAVRVAAFSPCAKSKRGAVVFYRPEQKTEPDRLLVETWGSIHASGFNGLPGRIQCDGSAECRRDCGKRCVHAEARAVRELGGSARHLGEKISALDIVHVKIGAAGTLEAGGGPSCWQCSREILDAGLGGVWLFESFSPLCGSLGLDDGHCERCGLIPDVAADCPPGFLTSPEPGWRRYAAEEFHVITSANAKGGAVYLGELR